MDNSKISRIYKGSELVYESPSIQPLTAFLSGLKSGDRIELFRAANIRTDAVISTATFKGVNPGSARGTIVGGPKTGIQNSIWYDINFDSGFDGWCVSDNYIKIGTGGPTDTKTTPDHFKVGNRVVLFRAANVRSSAGIADNLRGVNPWGTLGTITAGPTKIGGVAWYNINFDSGFDGWVVSDNFLISPITPPPPDPDDPDFPDDPDLPDGDDWVTGSCAPAVPSNGKIINVAAGGSIQSAINKANPGDTILVANGTYSNKVALSNQHSGNANGWITIKSATPYGAKLTGGLTMFRADYIRIEGFDFVGRVGDQSGIGATSCHHVQVLNNRMNIGLIFLGVSDFLLVEGNVVHGNVAGFNQIEILYPQNITGDTSTKNRIIVRNNVSYDNNRKENTDGSGIMIDCFSLERPRQFNYLLKNDRVPAKPYVYGAIVDNNICYDNHGPGIYVNYSDYITVTNNICYANHRRATGSGSTWTGNIMVISSKNNILKDNVFIAENTPTKNTYAIACQGFKDRSSTGNTWTNNSTYNKSKPGDASIAVMSTCPVPAAANQLGKGSQYASKPTDFLKEPCS